MADIVERLRGQKMTHAGAKELGEEAADKIQRLRQVAKAAKRYVDNGYHSDTAMEALQLTLEGVGQMTRDILTATIASLDKDAAALSAAWQKGDEHAIATTIKTIRDVLSDTETMLKDNMYRRLTSPPAFRRSGSGLTE